MEQKIHINVADVGLAGVLVVISRPLLDYVVFRVSNFCAQGTISYPSGIAEYFAKPVTMHIQLFFDLSSSKPKNLL
jgi:hypothetical protein